MSRNEREKNFNTKDQMNFSMSYFFNIDIVSNSRPQIQCFRINNTANLFQICSNVSNVFENKRV